LGLTFIIQNFVFGGGGVGSPIYKIEIDLGKQIILLI
jgi:hypothetical protein